MIKTQQLIDWTEELNLIQCKEKTLALATIDKYFDLEQVPISEYIKHYPVSTSIILSDSPEEDAALRTYSLERLNKQLWGTVLYKIGGVDFTENQKVGKLLYCTSSKFAYLGKEEDAFKAYCFECNGEIQAEINFTIEFY